MLYQANLSITKRHSKVLAMAQEYSLKMQAQLVSGLAVLHNFIQIHDPNDARYEAKDCQVDQEEPERSIVAHNEQWRANNCRERMSSRCGTIMYALANVAGSHIIIRV